MREGNLLYSAQKFKCESHPPPQKNTQNNICPNIWVPCSPFKLTAKINQHSYHLKVIQPVNDEAWTQTWSLALTNHTILPWRSSESILRHRARDRCICNSKIYVLFHHTIKYLYIIVILTLEIILILWNLYIIKFVFIICYWSLI